MWTSAAVEAVKLVLMRTPYPLQKGSIHSFLLLIRLRNPLLLTNVYSRREWQMLCHWLAIINSPLRNAKPTTEVNCNCLSFKKKERIFKDLNSGCTERNYTGMLKLHRLRNLWNSLLNFRKVFSSCLFLYWNGVLISTSTCIYSSVYTERAF